MTICNECETVAHCRNHGCIPKQPAKQNQAYKQANPLGGPAKVFDAMADAIRAGDNYHAVLRQYGFTELQPQQEPVAVFELQKSGWEIICDLDWIQTLPFGTKLYASSPAQRKPLTPNKCWKCGDSDPAFTDLCQVPACGMRD